MHTNKHPPADRRRKQQDNHHVPRSGRIGSRSKIRNGKAITGPRSAKAVRGGPTLVDGRLADISLGNWVYEFTKDFITIWPQRSADTAPMALPPSSPRASSTAATEPAVLGDAVALAATSHSSPQPQALELSPMSAVGGNCNCASCYDTALQARGYEVSALTEANKRDARRASTATKSSTVTSDQVAVQTIISTTQKSAHDHGHYHGHEHVQEASTAAHRHSHHSKKGASHRRKLSEVVRADKNKKHNSQDIVDRWNWEWGYGV